MKSPLTDSNDVTLEKDISVNEIVDFYKSTYNIEVRKYFSDRESISIYKCNESGYRFYYPLSSAGDSDFYIHFQQYEWYYMPWKWEHEMSLKFIQPNHKVLEVGCGAGGFLKRIHRDRQIDCVGLELNKDVAFQSDGLIIDNITVEEYSSEHKEEFDIACSFQVLEHIPLVNSFIGAQVECLKKNGLLIISVPNNDSFIKYGKHKLNMPPHHMGLWNENSLKSLQKYFNIRVNDIFFEPLQPYHFDFYTSIMIKRYFGRLGKIIMVFLTKFGLNKLINKYLAKKADSIKGHSIMIVFEKL